MKSINRRSARVFAMELLYSMEITMHSVGDCVEGVLASIKEASKKELPAEMKRYGMSLVDLVQEHRAEFEEIIKTTAHDWDLDRMALLDRIILCLALAELQYEPDVPVKVVLEEAVQISNKFSTESSSRFINGILNQYARDKGMLAKGDRSEEK
ncbi:MAG: transcription antitermination factor NusB [Fibrobacter sp.]|nr:transcription antitermination factor NusB [Fibrobacter sp.]